MSLLEGYYAAVNAEKYASARGLDATAGLTHAQTAQVAPNAEAQRALEGAQTADAGQRARLTGAQAGQVSLNDAAARGLQGAQAGLAGASTNLTNTQAGLAPGTATSENKLRGSESDFYKSQTNQNEQNVPIDQGYEKGGKVATQKQAVLGKAQKPGPTDTVPAMLTPGEAVLNKGAVHHYGTDVIEHMNKMGLLRMGAQSEVAKHLGLPDPHAPPPKASNAKKKGKGGRLVMAGAAPAPGMGGAAPAPVGGGLPGFALGGIVPVPLGLTPR